MKVLDLNCSQGHTFEGWFGSEDDFQSQLARGLVQCPICDDAKISKRLSAPRLNLRAAREARSTAERAPIQKSTDATNVIASRADSMRANSEISQKSESLQDGDSHPLHVLMRDPQFQAAYMEMAKQILAQTEDVGDDFAREARKMHYGESAQRGIRGQTTRDEALELLDEGIDVMPLPLPKALKGSLQ